MIRFIYRLLSMFPDFSFVIIGRRYFLEIIGAKIGSETLISRNVSIVNPENFSLGDYSGLGRDNIIDCHSKITIGSRVLIGPNVTIFTSNHIWSPLERTYYRQGFTYGEVIIGDDCWIGSNVIILPHVKLGKGVTIGAGSVVTKSIPDFAVAVGSPAKVIKYKDII